MEATIGGLNWGSPSYRTNLYQTFIVYFHPHHSIVYLQPIRWFGQMDVSLHRFGAICMYMICEKNKNECGPGDVTVEITPVA